MPPKVEYQLSELAKQLLVHMIALWTWVVENAAGFRRSRERFDADQVLYSELGPAVSNVHEVAN
ncbi:hypothetical protein [Pseudomonas yamanorum]|uniref:hypothetical protein n=1 Tax=Pseudomonas yamanorum TaxID=515393 RepID=UPI002111417F|nr:hypothetical protein [Pseudomonas yamanorum]